MTSLKLYWWNKVLNFGDVVSPVVVEYVAGMKVDYSTEAGKLLAAGSILEHAIPGDTVWGAGIDPKSSTWKPDGIRFLSVRGPLTRQLVLDRGGKCPPIYGDPALFLPQIYKVVPNPVTDAIAMPHMDDDVGWEYCHKRGIPTINPAWNWKLIVNLLLSANHVLSSSLHGVIVAEAYGVKASWMNFCNRFKFDDYYASTGRNKEPKNWGEEVSSFPY